MQRGDIPATKLQGTGLQIEEPVVIKKKWHPAWTRFRLRWRTERAAAKLERYAPAYRAFRDDVRGEFPKDARQGCLVAACNDYYYWNFAITMLHSIERHGRTEFFHLHLCEPSPQTQEHVRKLAASLKHVRLSWTADSGKLAQTLVYPTIYYASVRFLIADLVMEASGGPVLCLDIDGIAVRPIWPAFDAERGKADVVLIKRDSPKDVGRRILASALGIEPTEKGGHFARALARSIAAALQLKPLYHVDQTVIHYLTDRMERRHGLQVSQMPKALADFDFNEDAVIWTAKGWQRKKSDVYAQAMRAIEEQFPDELDPSHATKPQAAP